MTTEEWDAICRFVSNEMANHVPKFATPISMTEEPGSGVAWGSGGYLDNDGDTWLITASHVFTDAPKDSRLAHLPFPDNEYIAITNQPKLARSPFDVAAVGISALPVNSPSRAAPISVVSELYSAAPEELLFWTGFPGYSLERHDPIIQSKLKTTLFGQLCTPALPMLSQALQGEAPQDSRFDPDRHIAIHYPSKAKKLFQDDETMLPNAKGMSGSLLWNTRYIERMNAGETWTPDCAQVCGVIWGVLANPEVVVASRIEYVRRQLIDVFK